MFNWIQQQKIHKIVKFYGDSCNNKVPIEFKKSREKPVSGEFCSVSKNFTFSNLGAILSLKYLSDNPKIK